MSHTVRHLFFLMRRERCVSFKHVGLFTCSRLRTCSRFTQFSHAFPGNREDLEKWSDPGTGQNLIQFLAARGCIGPSSFSSEAQAQLTEFVELLESPARALGGRG